MQLALLTQEKESVSSFLEHDGSSHGPEMVWARREKLPRNLGAMTRTGAASESLASIPQGGLSIRVAHQPENHFSLRI